MKKLYFLLFAYCLFLPLDAVAIVNPEGNVCSNKESEQDCVEDNSFNGACYWDERQFGDEAASCKSCKALQSMSEYEDYVAVASGTKFTDLKVTVYNGAVNPWATNYEVTLCPIAVSCKESDYALSVVVGNCNSLTGIGCEPYISCTKCDGTTYAPEVTVVRQHVKEGLTKYELYVHDPKENEAKSLFVAALAGCQACPDGKYCENGIANDCSENKLCQDGIEQDCPPGYACKDGLANTCPAGYYCPGGGEGKQECSAGTTSEEGAQKESDCFISADTKFQDNTGGDPFKLQVDKVNVFVK